MKNFAITLLFDSILSFLLHAQEKQLPTMPMVISTKACSTMAFGKVLVCTRAPHPLGGRVEKTRFCGVYAGCT